MAKLNSLAAIASRLRVERAKLLSQLKHVDAALSVLGKLKVGGSYSAPRRINLSQKAKKTTNAQAMRDLGFDLLCGQELYGSGRIKTLEELERHFIHHVMRKEGGHVASAARKLGIPRSSLYHKLKRQKALGAKAI
jgi:DNA-binding NtrC family response regulator